jgi:hypothetical protein
VKPDPNDEVSKKEREEEIAAKATGAAIVGGVCGMVAGVGFVLKTEP